MSMTPWSELTLPKVSSIKQFAFPIDRRMLLRTGDGLYCLILHPIVELTKVMTADEISALDNGDSWGVERSMKLPWDGQFWFFHGADGGDITLCDLPTGERLELDQSDYNSLLILDSRTGEIIQRIEFPTATDPEDFSIAGFSEDHRYLLLCRPGELRVFHSALS